MSDAFKKLTSKGCCHGGWKCRHCGVSPGLERDMQRRRARRALKVADRLHVRHDLSIEYLHPAEQRMYQDADLNGIA